MTCDIIHTDKKDLEYRQFIMNSLECALKRGDEIFDKLVSKESNIPNTVSYDKFKESLKNINHENLKP